MNNQLVKTFVPLFPGFYVSQYDDLMDHETEYVAESFSETFPYVHPGTVQRVVRAAADFEAMRRKLAYTHAKNFVSDLTDAVRTLPGLASLQEPAWHFVGYTSPREYNFETDRLVITIGSAFMQRLHAALDYQVFSGVVRERHTSRSGFISFYQDDAANSAWQDPKNFDENQNETLLLAVIEQTVGVDDFGEQVVDETINDVDADGTLSSCFNYGEIENTLRVLNEQTA